MRPHGRLRRWFACSSWPIGRAISETKTAPFRRLSHSVARSPYLRRERRCPRLWRLFIFSLLFAIVAQITWSDDLTFQRVPRPVHFCNCGNHAWSALTRGYVTMVSPEDAHFLRARSWTAAENKKKKTVYARSTYTKLHREITAAPSGLLVDHHNGNGAENAQNARSHSDSTSKFKGVCWVTDAEKWCAQICKDGNRIQLGQFDEEIEAAKAYDAAALKLFGPYSKRNFAA